MTVAAFLNSSHRYDSIPDVDDVQDIIDALGTILKTNNSPVWTEPVAGTFKSPVDDDGRWFSVAVARTDVDTMSFTVKDEYGTTIKTASMDINASGSPAIEVKVYSGQYHLWIDFMRATPKNFRSGILDLSPQIQTAWSSVVYCGIDQGMDILSTSERMDDEQSVCVPIAGYNSTMDVDMAGNVMYWPAFIRRALTNDVYKGRMYQVLIGPSTIAYGTEVTVPIDTGVTAKFRAAGASPGGWNGQTTGCRYFVRAD